MSNESLFAQISLTDWNHDIVRNITAKREDQDLFDDLSDNPSDSKIAEKLEKLTKIEKDNSKKLVIDQPFKDAKWTNAIFWPFNHWQTSRFSDGSFGVWYGSESIETTVFETPYHWYTGLLRDAGFENEIVVAERKVYFVTCKAALWDLRKKVHSHPNLVHQTDYSDCQAIGKRMHHEGHPGLLTKSARRLEGENIVIFNPIVLSNPQYRCDLTYRLEKGHIAIEKEIGISWLTVNCT